MSTPEEWGIEFLTIFRRNDEGKAHATALYELMREQKVLNKHRLVKVVCSAEGCVLLDMIDTPAGVIVHQPRYKKSPRANEEQSNADGRRANTEDGDRRWKARTYPVEQAFMLNCDHVLAKVITLEELEEAIEAGEKRVTIHP